MITDSCAVILAGGEGKRMKSNRPKVLSNVLFKPMIKWVLDAAAGAGVEDICVVTGYLHEEVEGYLGECGIPGVEHAFQSERKGTGHAVMMADDFLRRHKGKSVLILNGDSPFINPQVIDDALTEHQSHGNAVTVISSRVENPTGYGRIVRDAKTRRLSGIVEQKDADYDTLLIHEVNSGAYWFQVDDLLSVLYKIQNKNAQGEYYLPDAVKLLIAENRRAGAFMTADSSAVLGANDCLQLGELNAIARDAILSQRMKDGVEIPCRDGVIIGPDVEIGAHVCILPGTILRGDVRIGDGCVLGPNTYLENCKIGANCVLNSVYGKGCTVPDGETPGPFSKLTPHNAE